MRFSPLWARTDRALRGRGHRGPRGV